MNDKIIFDCETGIMTINDIYEIKPRMTLPEVLESNLTELLSQYNNIGLEYIHKEGIESRILFRDFFVDGVIVRIRPGLSYDSIREIREIEIFVGDLGRDPSREEFNGICNMHEQFISKMCIPKDRVTRRHISFDSGYLDRTFCYRTPCAKIYISYTSHEVLNMSREELDEWMDEYENELYDLLDDND